MIKYIFKNIKNIKLETSLVVSLMIFSGFLEMISLGLLFPIIKYANGKDIVILDFKIKQTSEIDLSTFIILIIIVITFGVIKLFFIITISL